MTIYMAAVQVNLQTPSQTSAPYLDVFYFDTVLYVHG